MQVAPPPSNSPEPQKRVPRFLARVEFFAFREDIQKDLKAGYSYKAIYDALYPDKISMSYRNFCIYINQFSLELPHKTLKQLAKDAKISRSSFQKVRAALEKEKVTRQTAEQQPAVQAGQVAIQSPSAAAGKIDPHKHDVSELI